MDNLGTFYIAISAIVGLFAVFHRWDKVIDNGEELSLYRAFVVIVGVFIAHFIVWPVGFTIELLKFLKKH